MKQSFNQTNIVLERSTLCLALSSHDAETLSVALAQNKPWLTLGISAEHLKTYLLHEDVSLYRYVVRVQGETAGVMCLRYPWLKGPYIELLALLENYRGQGIGTELLAWLEQTVRNKTHNIWLATSAFNHQAIQFYHRHGFQQIGTLHGLVHPDYDELLLRKRL